MNLKRFAIIISLIVCVFFSKAEESAGGLLFTSSAEKVDKRTSMLIFPKKPQKVEDSFSISFDLSIWDLKQFGHIFRVINEQKKEVEFVFVNFYGIDKMYLDFHSPITHKSVQIPITKRNIEKKETLHIDIHFNLKEDKATIKLNGRDYSCSPIGLENPSYIQCAFGLYGLNLDVPQMLIKNLKFQESDNKSFFFPLKESAGEFAYDENGKLKAQVKNPEWIVNKHYYWQSKAGFNIQKKAYVAYDEENNRILITNNDSIHSYNPGNNSIISYSLKDKPSGFKTIDAVYNQQSGQCYLLGSDSIMSYKSVALSDNLKIEFLNPAGGRDLLHHNSFFSSGGDLYQFGGYANHSYSDKIYLYNKLSQSWEPQNFKGDRISPRFYSAEGNGVGPDERLIFGGFGNETGKQEHGGHNLYDLYLLNLKQKTIKNLWTLHESPKVEFIPGSNLILSKDKKHFYVFCYAHHISKTHGYLYRFNIKNGAYEVVSDSIRITSEDMNTSVNLFYNGEMNEFYTVIKEFSENKITKVHIYTLLSPSISKAELDNYLPRKNASLYILFLLLSVLMMAFAYVYFKKRHKKKAQKLILSESLLEPINKIVADKKLIKQSSVYLFGDFKAYDNKGSDISYRFSMKLRALFSIILLFTENESKISTEKLTSYLWPEKDTIEAKNIRGVTINRLRNILADMDGISLVHENSHWHFVYDNTFYCDYLEYTSALNQLKTMQSDYDVIMEKIVDVIDNGVFLHNVQEAVIENYKSKEEERIEILLREYIIHLYKEKQYKRIIAIASTYFAVEPINGEILDLCLKSYAKTGKREEAKVFLNNYKKTYKLLTGEEFK